MHFGHPNHMQELLEEEGIIVDNDKITNFETVYWDPSLELAL